MEILIFISKAIGIGLLYPLAIMLPAGIIGLIGLPMAKKGPGLEAFVALIISIGFIYLFAFQGVLLENLAKSYASENSPGWLFWTLSVIVLMLSWQSIQKEALRLKKEKDENGITLGSIRERIANGDFDINLYLLMLRANIVNQSPFVFIGYIVSLIWSGIDDSIYFGFADKIINLY